MPRSLALVFALLGALAALPAGAQEAPETDGGNVGAPARPMTVERLARLVAVVDAEAKTLSPTAWQFRVEGREVMLVSDPAADRMRIMTPIAPADGLEPAMLLRLMQANFDSALDARYAVAQNLLWGVFVHPLSSLSDRQLLSGLGQTVNVANSFGTAFASGELVYGGGDSEGLIGRMLIERLLEKAEEI